MPVAKPTEVPRWADGGTNTATNVVDPPEHNGSIAAWAPGPYTVATFVSKSGNYYIVTAIAGTGTSTAGPAGTGTTIDNPGANQVTWQWVTATPVTKDSGWLPNIQPPAQFFNWLFFTINSWILWLQDIANQNFSDAGTNHYGPWTQPHKFTGGSGAGINQAAVTIAPASGDEAVGLRVFGGANTMGGAGGSAAEFTGGATNGNGIDVFAAPGGVGAAINASGSSTSTSGGPAVNCLGGASSAAGYFQGGPVPSGGGSAGPAIQCTGGPGREGAVLNGGSGDSPAATCTSSGNGIGCVCLSAGSGAALACANFGSGPALQAVAGSGSPAVLAQSSTSQTAIKGDASAGTGKGAEILGGAGSPGMIVTPGFGQTLATIDLGSCQFGSGTDANPGKTLDCGTNVYGAPHVSKAWASLVCASGTITWDGVGITSIAAVTSPVTGLLVTFSHGMANTRYGVTFGGELPFSTSAGTNYIWQAVIDPGGSKTITAFIIQILEVKPGTGTIVLIDPAASAFGLDFDVKGRHV